jgi:hypothetical protein
MEEKSMTNTSTLLIVVTVILAPVYLAKAQKQAPIPRIGILRPGAPPPDGSPQSNSLDRH